MHRVLITVQETLGRIAEVLGKWANLNQLEGKVLANELQT